MSDTIAWPPSRRRRRGRLVILAVLAVLVLGGGTALSYYVDALWFGSLGYADVFWKTLNLQAAVFIAFAAMTFLVLYGSFLALKPAHLADFAGGGTIIINGQPVKLPVEPVLRLIALGVSLAIAAATGAGMMAEWSTLALYWYAPSATGTVVDPIFGRPLNFYLFTLPAWQLIAGWLTTLAVITCAVAGFFIVITGGTRALAGRRGGDIGSSWRGLSITFAFLLLMLAAQVYLGRFGRLFDDHTIFTGVTYTDAHVTLTGLLVVSIALLLGAGIAAVNAVSAPRVLWLAAAVVPAAVCYVGLGVFGWYVNSFIVKPNELVRERPYITHNIELTRQAYGLDRISQRAFPAETSIEAVDPVNNQATLRNIRLWDWRALQDTLRQIQAIRTYYDFPDIDIDRYAIDGAIRQVMLATRELSIEKLPESSRNWINEKLIYTHGYGITMNSVNGFTPEGLPTLIQANMPVQSTVPGLAVKRPEVYFGELTNTDVYVKTRQKEFNYPQGETNSLTSYEGNGGIVLGGILRRMIIALDRGDLAKLPFSDDVTAESRLLMRRNVRDRVAALAPFLTVDPDPYIVLDDDGRLSWLMDAFTVSDSYPYSRHYRLNRNLINYMRNSVKVVVDAYDGTTTFYVFDPNDPIVGAYRGIFPSLFKDAAAMPPGLRKHVRYPELLLEMQAAVYGLYHMTSPDVFYNREDLWTVATEVGMNERREQATQAMEPNFVLMKLPEESATEFIEILPFTPANRNNLIGWIAGRSDQPHYGDAIVYDFPKTKLVDGPLQVEARIDQNAQLSGQLSLWNQQGSHVRRGALLVIPIGRALLYAEPIYLQAERSPMPQLRLVVLATQDRLAYGPTFESALNALFGGGASSTTAVAAIAQAAPAPRGPASAATPETAGDLNALIAEAAKDLAEYQRLTSEGKLGEAGQRLEDLKRKLEELQKRRR
ncbi:MAG: membrane protein [Acidobacteria bacterium]|nr:MAG: membrane protein [Acidobacteriota bacterium]